MVIRTEDLNFGVRRIVIARPQARNAIDDEVRRRLEEELDRAIANSSVRAVILAGEGAHFSVGGDIKFLRTLDRAGFIAFHRGALALVRKLAGFPKPLIASVRGACAGGSVGFALCADYLVASRTAYFGIQFMRIGLTPDMGVLYLLHQRLGKGARRLILDDRLVRAEEAASLGLCDKLVEDDALESECLELASRLGALAPKAFRQTKWLFRRTEGEFENFLNDEMTAAADCLGSSEFIEGTRAFFEKRAPRFPAL
jgi:enoyl-CoA hydratase/carnithine racemase